MKALSTLSSRSLNYLSTMGLADIVDILIVAYIIFRIVLLVRRTNLYNVAKGLIFFIIALWLSEVLKLTMINFILRKTAELGLIALVILFQPELRRLLERLGSSFMKSSGRTIHSTEIENAITQTVMACDRMSELKTGALIVFERKVSLNDVIGTGTVIDSEVSAELLKNIFYNKAPLHDGAVVIRNGRIAAAGCMLPLTANSNLSKDLGMRHRAGIGMSEQSDAVVLIVSEETGAISCSIEGMLKRHLTGQAADRLLRKELVSDTSASEKKNIIMRIVSALFGFSSGKENNEKDN